MTFDKESYCVEYIEQNIFFNHFMNKLFFVIEGEQIIYQPLFAEQSFMHKKP